LAAWEGKENNVAEAQKLFFKRCQLNGLAREGKYNRAMETAI
ncbi:MAG: class I fructose-bisphosphate aldolase, partial [Nitrosospira sp.]